MIKEINLSYTRPQLEIFFDWPEGVRFKGVQKGRRFGATKGAANAFIEWAIEGTTPMLWGDTIHGNIDRYFERYFVPELKKNDIKYHWNGQSKQLKIGNSFIDFRSEDNPQNWEGFGYMIIFVNEAGIIMKNKYLYVNAILPMLMDFPNSRLIAAGVPKGKKLKDGSEHPFYTICKSESPTHKIYKYSSYDNPLLDPEDIKDLEAEIGAMSPTMVAQEIYGEFIDTDAENPFFHAFNEDRHFSTLTKFDPNKPVFMSIDFNLNPFCITFWHIWRDKEGEHCHAFDEMSIKNGSIPAMIDAIRAKYKPQLIGCFLTGDAMGKRGELSQRDNASLYLQLQRGLGLNDRQIRVIANPTHENSRTDCAYVMTEFPDFKINPDTCPGLARDVRVMQCDAFGGIIKRNRADVNQLADFGDTLRYLVNTFLREWLHKTMKSKKR